MNWILTTPLPLRLACLFVLGAAVGSLLNLLTYRLAERQRSLSPWSAPPPGVAKRHWSDCIPVFGWWALRRESKQQGTGFWIRPLFVEAATGVLFAGLYVWEVVYAGLYSLVLAGAPPVPCMVTGNLQLVLHAQFASHVVLFSLMIVASLIDLDEKNIPDAITISGTLVGLAVATIYPWSLPPAAVWMNGPEAPPLVEFLELTAPNVWTDTLDGMPNLLPLAIALGCWTVWCGGLMPRYWNTRRGWGKAARFFLYRLHDRKTYESVAIWIVGTIAIVACAGKAPTANWAGLLTALVGMAVSGGLIWIVRNVAGPALGREAMGFGDVTLMAMVGTFVGWQPSLVIFFLAPFLGVFFAIIQWIIRREHEIPYGPFLCLAAFGVIVGWAPVWDRSEPIFWLGWIVPGAFAVCVTLMGIMLLAYRMLLDRWAGNR